MIVMIMSFIQFGNDNVIIAFSFTEILFFYILFKPLIPIDYKKKRKTLKKQTYLAKYIDYFWYQTYPKLLKKYFNKKCEENKYFLSEKEIKKLQNQIYFCLIFNIFATFFFVYCIWNLIDNTGYKGIYYFSIYAKNDIQKLWAIYFFIRIISLFIFLTNLVELELFNPRIAVCYILCFLYSIVYNLRVPEIMYLPKDDIFFFFIITFLFFVFLLWIFKKSKKDETLCFVGIIGVTIMFTAYLFFFKFTI